MNVRIEEYDFEEKYTEVVSKKERNKQKVEKSVLLKKKKGYQKERMK